MLNFNSYKNDLEDYNSDIFKSFNELVEKQTDYASKENKTSYRESSLRNLEIVAFGNPDEYNDEENYIYPFLLLVSVNYNTNICNRIHLFFFRERDTYNKEISSENNFDELIADAGLGIKNENDKNVIYNLKTPTYSNRDSSAFIYGIYPGSSRFIVFKFKQSISLISDENMIPGMIRYDINTLIYTGNLLLFKTLNHDFFANLESVKVYYNNFMSYFKINNDLYGNSKIYKLLNLTVSDHRIKYASYRNIFTGNAFTRDTSISIHDIIYNNLDNLSVYRKFIYMETKDDRIYKIEPLLINLRTSSYISYEKFNEIGYGLPSIIDEAETYGFIGAILIGTYANLVITYPNLNYIKTMNYKYIDNGDYTYSVNSKDNLDKFGVIWEIDMYNRPLYIKMTDANFSLIEIIKRLNVMISYCKEHNIVFPHPTLNKEISETPYEIGEILTKSVTTVTDIPSKLSQLDNY